MIQNYFFKNILMIGFALCVLASLILIFMGHWSWSFGVLIGCFWIYLNTFFLFRLLEIGMTPHRPKQKDRILVLSILKFPVLYLAGFFILKSRFFPVYSILTGLTVYLLTLCAGWFWFNMGHKQDLEKGFS